MQVKVEICGVNTAKLVVLKNEETLELIEKAQAGDKEALEGGDGKSQTGAFGGTAVCRQRRITRRSFSGGGHRTY